MSSSYIPSYHDLEVSFSTPKSSGSSKATVHYVEAGDSSHATILSLHGFASSSIQYRDLIPMLSDSYHVLAPDYPGFGLTKVSDDFLYNSKNITIVIAAWLRALGIKEAAIYIQDFCAPLGKRLAITNGLKPTAIITHNGNAYHEGVASALDPLGAWWKSKYAEDRKVAADNMLILEGPKEHIVMGTPEKDVHLLDPQHWHLSYLQNMAGEANRSSKMNLLYDYRTHVEQYPEYQKYVRESKVPVLAVWNKNDLASIYPGAEAFRKDAPDATIHLLDADHFALETKRWEIARIMKQSLTNIGL